MPCLDTENTPLPGDTENVLLRKLLNRLCNVTSGGGGGVSQAYVDAQDAATLLAAMSSASALYVLKAGDTMTGALLQPAGTVGAPALARSTDTDTGIWYPGANILGLAAGAVDSLRIQTGGPNVPSGLAYLYNGVQVVTAQTAMTNYYFGNAGNLTGTGATNTAVGSSALAANTTGSVNAAIGAGALVVNTTGAFNVAVGVSALGSNVSGVANMAIGYTALLLNTSDFNCAIGYQAMQGNTSGNNNTGIGRDALLGVTTGSNNIGIGSQAGGNLTTGTKNILIGQNISAPSATAFNQLVLANILFGTGCSGTGTTIAGSIGIGINTPLARLHITPAASGTDYFRIDHSDGTPRFQVGALTGALTNGALWFGNITPDATNYGLANDGATTFLNADTGGAINFSLAGTSVFNMSSAGHLLWTPDNTYNIGAAGANRPANYFGAGTVNAAGGLITGNVASLVTSSAAMNDGAAAALGTLTNAPAAGNPTKWIPIDDNGTTRYIPTW